MSLWSAPCFDLPLRAHDRHAFLPEFMNSGTDSFYACGSDPKKKPCNSKTHFVIWTMAHPLVIEELNCGGTGDPAVINEAADLAARAFWNDPLYQYLYRSEQQRRELLARHFLAYLSGAVRVRVFGVRNAATGRLVSFAAYIPQPGSQWNEQWDEFMSQHAVTCSRLEFCDGAAVHARLEVCSAHWGAELHDETCWYLLLLVTDPAHHGQGHGRALVAHGKRHAKLAGCGVDLDASHATLGVPFYESLGFAAVERWQAPHMPNRELLRECGCANIDACAHRENTLHLSPLCVYMRLPPEQLRDDASVESWPAPR
jgi:GNAT superfamily N-acetyltransferase